MEVVVGGHRPPARARQQLFLRREGEEPRVLPHVGVLVPVVLARQAAVGDDQRRRVADLALAEQRQHVLVDRRRRQVVLDAGMAVLNHRLVVVEQRAAFGDHQHLQLAGRLEDHLARVAPFLVVALDAEGAGRLHPPQVHQRIVVGVDHRLVRRFGAVEDGAGGEQPRPELEPGADHLAVGEHRLGVVRRIVRGGDAERQIGGERPARLRQDAARFTADVAHERRPVRG